MSTLLAGIKSVQSKIQAYTTELGKKWEKGGWAGGIAALGKSLERVPRDTEALAKSSGASERGAGFTYVVTVGYANPAKVKPGYYYSVKSGTMEYRYPPHYAEYVHAGHNQPPQNRGFLRNAVHENLDLITQQINQFFI